VSIMQNTQNRSSERAQPAEPIRVGLNLLHAMPAIGGGWVYIANLLAALATHDHNNTYVAFVTSRSRELVPIASNFQAREIKVDSRSRIARVLCENTVLPRWVARERLDCVHWFANGSGIVNAAPALVTVYDLQPILNLAGYSLIKRMFVGRRLRVAARRAARLLPISVATAEALRLELGVSPDRCTVLPAIVEEIFKPLGEQEAAAFRSAHSLPQNFWLYVATLLPYKNHLLLLHAYREARASGGAQWPLILRAGSGVAEESVRAAVIDLKLSDCVRFLEPLRREEVPKLYACASMLVFPSTYEGAGIPLVEAMACGCPVVASDIPVVREATGDAAVYFSPTQVDSIAGAMVKAQASPALRERCRQLGFQRAESHRGPKVAPALVGAYTRVVTDVRQADARDSVATSMRTCRRTGW
jgi:glycosyltransferase involved in cell wall biosynthesis